MKFNPLNSPNVSSSKFLAKSLSFSLDNRGLPQISWEEYRNGQNGILFRFWDGLQWAHFGDIPLVDRSYGQIIHSNRSLALVDGWRPMIAYGRLENDYNVCIAKMADGAWEIEKVPVAHSIKWIGVHILNRINEYSSSSSSSLIDSSSSSSIFSTSSSSMMDSSGSSSKDSSSSSSILSISSTSMSSEGGRSSTSNAYSPSSLSSSQDSSSTSSSSSFMDVNVRILVIDNDNVLRIYSYDGGLSESASITLGGFDEIKTFDCGLKLGIIVRNGSQLKYNFYDLSIDQWAFASFTTISEVSECVSFDACGYNVEDDGAMLLAWTEPSSLNLLSVDSSGNERNFYQTKQIEVFLSDFSANNFGINTKGNTAIALDEASNTAYVMLCGSQNTIYKIDSGQFDKYVVEIVGQPMRYNPSNEQVIFDVGTDFLHYSFISQSNVYYYYGLVNGDLSKFVPSPVTILNSQRYKYGIYHEDENILDAIELPCAWDNRTGDMLLEAERRVVVFADEGEDPDCFTSSSSSSGINDSIDTTMTSIDDDLCGIKIAAGGGIEGFYKEYILDAPAYGDCVLCYWFKTYRIKDRLIITFYDVFESMMAQVDTGCISTGTGWKTGCVTIPAGTKKVVVEVLGGCDANDPSRQGTAWVLRTSCTCDSSTSSSSVSSISDISSASLSSQGKSSSSPLNTSDTSLDETSNTSFGYSSDSSPTSMSLPTSDSSLTSLGITSDSSPTSLEVTSTSSIVENLTTGMPGP